MAKLSVLEITQDILSDMNSDEVNSISDTLESMQVAQIVKSVYEELMARKNWPHLEQLIVLSPLTAATPTHMSVPEAIKELTDLYYDKRKTATGSPSFERVEWLAPSEWLEYTNTRKTSQTDYVQVTDPTGIPLIIKNDKAPTYFTTFDDEHVVFDSYDSSLETNLQASKTQCRAFIMPAFTLSDGHVPDLPVEMFPAFLAECKSTCFARIKQMVDQKAEQQSKRSMNWLSRKAFQVHGGIAMPDYGRRGKR